MPLKPPPGIGPLCDHSPDTMTSYRWSGLLANVFAAAAILSTVALFIFG